MFVNEVVYIQNVFINTYVQQNTVLVFGGGITVSINNAPTQFITNVLGTSTSTATTQAVATVTVTR